MRRYHVLLKVGTYAGLTRPYTLPALLPKHTLQTTVKVFSSSYSGHGLFFSYSGDCLLQIIHVRVSINFRTGQILMSEKSLDDSDICYFH